MLYKAYIWKSVVKIRLGCIEFLLNNNINKQVHLHQHCITQLLNKYAHNTPCARAILGVGLGDLSIKRILSAWEVVYFVSYHSLYHITLHN